MPSRSAGFVLAAPLYYALDCYDNENPEYDRFSVEVSRAMVLLCGGVMKNRGHGHLFCIAQQLGKWHLVLKRCSAEEEIVYNKGEEALQKK